LVYQDAIQYTKVVEVRETDLPKLAKKIVKDLKGGDIIAMSGPLAAGKTTLTKAIVLAMGYTGRVASPTFVLERQYTINCKGIKKVVHLDFYRLSEKELSSFDWQDALADKDRLTIIEWPEIAQAKLPKDVKTITIDILNDKKRRLTFSDNFAN
jgi:tRNA threonylcarbamoyl adenosine modification protein YjeE